MRLSGRTALVTGSARGIGAAIARRLAADGARVVVHGRAASSASDALAEEIGAQAVFGDLAEGETASEIVRQAFAVHGGLDILVLNAGGGSSGRIEDVSLATIDG